MASFNFFICLFALIALLSLSTSHAAPLAPRQIGNLTCNIDRIKIVAALASTKNALSGLTTAAANDPAASAAAAQATEGIDSADAGVATIAKALLTLQAAPAAARDQVGAGLTQAQTALNSINSTDPAVTAKLSSAQGSLTKAITAGQGVVDNCK
ncbi:hypothetical protein BD410DRAFT_835224 [Rickenella mellea]|uniref:Hydrophobic surface binding protein n=1 Tax=Rickenella mellea TaxID=50990 RepID=A0A4Y7QJY5_9AGAM|nr:hypothetical protein BD410DRAFT_835224 [Rickenella mellea]